MKLISMTDFVLNESKTKDKETSIVNIYNYALFLKQPLKLEMFVPCDENKNVLQEPGLIPSFELEQYRKAKEKVLFEGFYYQSNYSEKQNKLYEYVRNKHPHVFSFEQINNNTIESLLLGYKEQFRITLTPNATKQFL